MHLNNNKQFALNSNNKHGYSYNNDYVSNSLVRLEADRIGLVNKDSSRELSPFNGS